jgi:hypothetical protein
MKYARVLVLLVVLVLAVGNPAVEGWRARARPVEAQYGVLATWVVDACTLTMGVGPEGLAVCAAFVTTGLILWVNGGGVATEELLKKAATQLSEWYADNLGDDGVQQFVAQYDQHPAWYYMSPQMVGAWASAFSGLMAAGWEYSANWANLGYAGWEYQFLTTSGVQQLETAELVLPSGANCAMVQASGGRNLRGPSGTTSGNGTMYWVTGTPAVAYTVFSLSMYAVSPTATNLASAFTWATGCAHSGETGFFRWRVPDTGAAEVSKYAYFAHNPMVSLRWWVDGTDPILSIEGSDLVAVEADIAAVGTGSRVNAVMTPDSLVGWNGLDDLPLASGRTGAVVIPAPTEDAGWWEGLFGGLGGLLGGIKSAVESVGSTASAIKTLVTDLPTTMVGALTAAVVPTTSLETRVDETAGELDGKAPFAWPAIIFAVVADLFDGGSSCPVIDMHTDLAPGWPSSELNMCLPDGAQTILYAITDAVAASMVILWAYWSYRRLVES